MVVVLEMKEPLDCVGVRGTLGDAPWEAIAGHRDGEERPGSTCCGRDARSRRDTRRQGVLEVAREHRLVNRSDERAALGLAGLAIRAGARSALATLWRVNDRAAAKLVSEFYRQLAKPESSRAGALQAAQLEILGQSRYEHPGYWSPFLLIGSWP